MTFEQDLMFSQKASDDLLWERFYRQLWPQVLKIEHNITNIEDQKIGIDRLIYLPHNRIIRIDEKKRRKQYNDICLEYIHRYDNGTTKPGWIEKDLAIDYLAYAFMDTKLCYFFPWDLLRRVWRENNENWLTKDMDLPAIGFSIVAAKNPTYMTFSLAVPIDILLQKIQDTMVVQL